MSTDAPFTSRSLSGSEYVRELFEAGDNVAVLVWNRATGQTVQRMIKAETVSSPAFQTWLTYQNLAGSDLYVRWNRTGVCSFFCRQLGSAQA
jgi:hypothetical protein